MALLLQFNDCVEMTGDELRERTKLEEKEWKRHMQPLIDNKLIQEVWVNSWVMRTGYSI